MLTCSCPSDNDLFRLALHRWRHCRRYDTPLEAVQAAPAGSGVLLLASQYPDDAGAVGLSVWQTAIEKRLRVYVEYVTDVPGSPFIGVRQANWERGVVAGDALLPDLQPHRIMALHACRYLVVQAGSPMLVIARVAGFDTALYGLPDDACPLLYRSPDYPEQIWAASTALSQFVTARYAPTDAWAAVWSVILRWVLGNSLPVRLSWTPRVAPMLDAKHRVTPDTERTALSQCSRWYHTSRLLVRTEEGNDIASALAEGREERDMPASSHRGGDGRHGLLEGYSSQIWPDGRQRQRIPLRADCNAEAAMVLALDWAVNRATESRNVATNLLDFVYARSGMHGGVRGNPKHPAYGLIAWGAIAPAWEVANYGDDAARVALATMLAAACLQRTDWDDALTRVIWSNLRTTGMLGFRGDRVDIPALEAHGWRHFFNVQTVNYAPHFESYLWACYLWAYRQTGYSPLSEKAICAIRMTMDAYPHHWRWGDTIERARMLLCLAWLVRVDDTAEHRGWLNRVAHDLLQLQDPCGAIRETVNAAGGGGHYVAPSSNEAYGTSETPLIQTNDDAVSDQLYTTGFALLGLHEAVGATGDAGLAQAEQRLAHYLCRIQNRSTQLPWLHGSWFRAFDFKRWEPWASSADVGWGAWCVESGWSMAWTAAVLGLRQQQTTLWEITAPVRIDRCVRSVMNRMAENDGGPWRGGAL